MTVPGHCVDTDESSNNGWMEVVLLQSVSVTVSNEDFSDTLFLVKYPASSILTVCDFVSSNPLVRILTSLSDNLEDFLGSTELELNPLISVVMFCRPWSDVPSTFLCVQRNTPCSVVFVPSSG